MNCPVDQTERAKSAELSAPIARWRLVAALLLILLLGASLRFYRVTELEPTLWDEGCYFLEARFFTSLCEAVWDSAKLYLVERTSKEDVWKRQEQLPTHIR